jgi:K+-transporting ATPase ATPase B chain
MKNPVMFVVEVVAALTTVIFVRDWMNGAEHLGFTFQIILWLWITVLFANFAEAVAEGRGKAQAASLRQTREETKAKLIVDEKKGLVVPTPSAELAPGQVVLVEAGDLIPSDGEVIEGVASVNEAAITGESAPVIREAGGDRSARHRRHAGRFRLAHTSAIMRSRKVEPCAAVMRTLRNSNLSPA